jgi:hypothetical protein
MTIQKYLQALIEEKGASVHDEIILDGYFGLTWTDLVTYIESAPEHHSTIRNMLVQIDFKNGDVFHYLTFLANGMIQALGY